MLKRLLSILALLAFLVPAVAFAQTGTITGTVTEAKTGNVLPGVNVALEELNRGAATGAEGNYTIEDVPPGTYTLRASFIGYQAFSTEITLEAGETITQDIELQEGAVGLEEVVVTGYGQEKTAGELTGSVSNLQSQNINEVPVQNANQLLQGRAAGVSMSAQSGNPGAGFEVNIRGQGSINAGNQPLYIVDGVQMSFSGSAEETSRSPLNAIDPGNIKSIQVLKDAAAAAIYGAQAANGVVLIQTKSGREGETQVSVNFEGGARFQTYRFNMMNTEQWAERQINAFGEDIFRKFILTGFGHPKDAKISELPDFNWQEYIFEPGSHMKTSFTASGGDDDTQFFLSGNWQRTGGAVKRADYKQTGLRANLGQQLTPNFNLDVNFKISNQVNAGLIQDNFWIPSPFYQGIAEEPPIARPFTDEGGYYADTEEGKGSNPAVELNEETRELNTTQILANLSPELTLAPWLTLQGDFGLDYQQFEGENYETPIDEPGSGGDLQRRFSDITNLTANVTLNGDYTFGDAHNVSGVVGTEYRREFEEEEETGFDGFGNRFIRVPAGASRVSFFQGFNTEFRLLSYLGRLNYDYDGRYIATITARYDGSSRFGSATRWGFFPSGSIGWRIAQEDFFNLDFVETLKLRASYGITGNSQIGNFASRGLFDAAGLYKDVVGFRGDQLANPRLSWEENREINLGLDWALFGGRLSGSVNAYRSISDNLLLDRPLPSSSGYGEITENIGKVQNRGLEFSLETVNVQTEAVRWSTRFNLALTTNTVKELTPGVDELQPGSTNPIAEGHGLEAWKVYDYAGVNPADGRPMYYDKDGNLTYFPTEEDRKFLDSAREDVVGGIGSRFSYKGLSLDVFFDYSFGAKAWPVTQSSWSDAFGENLLGFIAEKGWKKPGDMAVYPRAEPFGSYANAEGPDYTNGETSTMWLYKANFVRLKNITLSYQVPSGLASQIGLSDARLYVTALNLWHKSPYLGIDPEVAGEGEQSSYPTEQQINVGIEVDL